jgi:hypothetical protein
MKHHRCEICDGTLQQDTTISKDGASLSFYVCPWCGAIYALFVAPKLSGGYALFLYVGDGQWEKVDVAESA